MIRAGTIPVVLTIALLAGCKGTQRSNGGASRDPLLGRYIPKQDLPIPERRDPLLTAPVARPKSTASNAEPFRNTRQTSIAGLAGNVRVEDTGLSLGDRRVTAEPASGVPLRKVDSGESWDEAARELRRLKARYDAPVRDGNVFVMTATVPRGDTGAMKRYEAIGTTPAAAAKRLLEHIQYDQ